MTPTTEALIAEAERYIAAKFDNGAYEARMLSDLITALRAAEDAAEANTEMWLNTAKVMSEKLRAAEAENEALKAQLAETNTREQKGRQYLMDICGIGSEDPMDFLCAAHAHQRTELDTLRAQLAERGAICDELAGALEEIKLRGCHRDSQTATQALARYAALSSATQPSLPPDV
jgi:cytidylate kinase